MLTIINIIIGLLPTLLPAVGVSANLNALIVSMSAALTALVAGLVNKQPVSTELTALQSALSALEADTSIDPAILAGIQEGITDLKAAIVAYQAAEVTTDPTDLTPLPAI